MEAFKMVKQIKKANKVFYQCEDCGLYYKTKIFAVKCENFCKTRKACSLEITKHAIRA